MSNDGLFTVPSELDLIEFFGAEPVERVTEDGYWCFEASDERGIKLRLSFNTFERSVQTELSLGAYPIDTVTHELAERLYLDGDELRGTFTTADSKTLVVIMVAPISVKWSTLRTR